MFKSTLKVIQLSPTLNGSLRNYAFKSNLKIKWVRPEKIPCIDPKKSGDLKPMDNIDKSVPTLDYQQSKELESADDTVKRLFSLEFAPRKETTAFYVKSVVGNTHSHNFDTSSVEAQIAGWTGIIRQMQAHADRHPRNKRLKAALKEIIDKRKKHLKLLRRADYKKFEWILETLDIVYKPPPEEFRWVARRESLVKLTDKYCEKVRQEKLDAYRILLENEQPVFLEEKIRALEFLRDEQKECGAEVTITQEEIDEAKDKLVKLKQKESVEEEKQNK